MICSNIHVGPMPCSNNDHVDRLDFIKNEKEETFMFQLISHLKNLCLMTS
jgi:hypothetical protein